MNGWMEDNIANLDILDFLELVVGVVKKKKRYPEWLQPLHKDQGQMPFSIVGPYCNDTT
jgi:hypothetical protein